MQGVGQINDPDEAFNLHRRVYPLPLDASTTEPTTIIPPSSGRLLDKEGWVNPPPLRNHFELQMGREPHLRELAMHLDPLGLPPDRMYGGEAQFGYDGIAYHQGINHPLYDPSGRGQDARYGPYSSRYILPPPFVQRYMGYVHDSAMPQHGTMGRRPYADPPHPFRGPDMTGHSSGGRDLSAETYQLGHNSTSSNAEAGPSTLDGTQRSAASRNACWTRLMSQQETSLTATARRVMYISPFFFLWAYAFNSDQRIYSQSMGWRLLCNEVFVGRPNQHIYCYCETTLRLLVPKTVIPISVKSIAAEKYSFYVFL